LTTYGRIATVSTEETPTAVPAAEQPGSAGPETWGTPPAPGAGKVEVPTQVEMRPHWSARKVIGAVVLAVIIVGGGTAVAIAATQPNSTTDAQPNAGVSGGQVTSGSGGSGKHSGNPGPFTNTVHGDFVVHTSSGGFATECYQTGRVTKLGAASITVTSQDHYAAEYLIAGSTVLNHGAIDLANLKVGDPVTIIATLSGNTATATTVTDFADKQPPTTHAGDNSGGMQPNDTTPASPGN
jgi:hypothetical protein